MAFLEHRRTSQKSFGDHTVVQGLRPRASSTGEFVSLPRPLRLRQDHDAAHDRRLRDADRRARSASTARTSPHLHAEPAQDRHGVPGLCAVPQHDRRRQRRLRPQGRAACRRPRSRAARRGDAEADRPAAARRALSLPALGRPAAARGAGPRARRQAAGAAARRAAVGARRQDPRLAARGDPRASSASSASPRSSSPTTRKRRCRSPTASW